MIYVILQRFSYYTPHTKQTRATFHCWLFMNKVSVWTLALSFVQVWSDWTCSCLSISDGYVPVFVAFVKDSATMS